MKVVNSRWWSDPKNDVHNTLATVFRTIRDETTVQTSADTYHAGFYRATESPGLRGESLRGYEYSPATLPYNVCRSAVDALTSKVSKHRPLPTVMTKRGSWRNQKKARKLTQFVEGEFYKQKFFENFWANLIRDALIFGRGYVWIYTDGDQICTERPHPWEVHVDPVDAHYGSPRNMYHVRSVDREVAIATWARTESGGTSRTIKEAIESAGRFDILHDEEARSQATVDRIDVIEAWHLPSRKGAKDGRHVVAVHGATLVDEAWEYDYFPFVMLSYNQPIVGYFGHGMVEQLEGYQYDINMAAEKVSEQFRMSGVFVTVPDNARIHEQQIRNGITTLFHRPGGVPTVTQMDLVSDTMRQRPRELTQDALNDAGLSQMSVQSQKPAGITAAIALQTLDDVETERFMSFGRHSHAACAEVARHYIDCAKKIANDYGDYAVSVPMRGGMLDLSWKEIDLEVIELKIFNSSLLKDQPAARLEQLKDLFNTGLIGRGDFLRYLDAPDMQAEMDLQTAGMLLVDEMLERMLEADESEGAAAYLPPNAYLELEVQDQTGAWVPGFAPRRCHQALLKAKLDGCPEFNTEMLERWLEDCQREMVKAANTRAAISGGGQPAMPGGPMGGGAPGGPPPAAKPQAPELPGLGIPGGSPPLAA